MKESESLDGLLYIVSVFHDIDSFELYILLTLCLLCPLWYWLFIIGHDQSFGFVWRDQNGSRIFWRKNILEKERTSSQVVQAQICRTFGDCSVPWMGAFLATNSYAAVFYSNPCRDTIINLFHPHFKCWCLLRCPKCKCIFMSVISWFTIFLLLDHGIMSGWCACTFPLFRKLQQKDLLSLISACERQLATMLRQVSHFCRRYQLHSYFIRCHGLVKSNIKQHKARVQPRMTVFDGIQITGLLKQYRWLENMTFILRFLGPKGSFSSSLFSFLYSGLSVRILVSLRNAKWFGRGITQKHQVVRPGYKTGHCVVSGFSLL